MIRLTPPVIIATVVAVLVLISSPGTFFQLGKAGVETGAEIGKAGVEVAQTLSDANKEIKETVADTAQQELRDSAQEIEQQQGENPVSSLLTLYAVLIGLAVAVPGCVFAAAKFGIRFL